MKQISSGPSIVKKQIMSYPRVHNPVNSIKVPLKFLRRR